MAAFAGALALGAVLLAGCTASSVGIEYYNTGNWERATPKLREAMIQEPERRAEIRPYYIRSVVQQADGLAAAGRYESALELVSKAQELERDDADLRNARIRYLLGYGRRCLEVGNLDLARGQAQEVLRMSPSNQEARHLVGDITVQIADTSLRAGKLSAAFDQYKNFLAEFPDNEDIRMRAADVLVLHGKGMAKRRQTRDALAAFATALDFNPKSVDAINEAILAAEAPPRVLVENYKFLLDKGGTHVALRRKVIVQLQRRTLDMLDADDPSNGRMFALAAYELDTERQQHLAAHEGGVLRVAGHFLQRGEVPLSIATLREAAGAMPLLAERFLRRAEAIRVEDEKFYVRAGDDLAFLGQLASAMQSAMAREATNPIVRSKDTEMMEAVRRQSDSLQNVVRRKNRATLQRQVFQPGIDALERLQKAVSAEDFATYEDLLQRYQSHVLRLPDA